MWSFKKIYIAVFVSLLIIWLVYAADNWYRVDSWKVIWVTNYWCANVDNDSVNDYFIPAKTLSEWNAFSSNAPNNVYIEWCCWEDLYLVNYTHSDCTAVGNWYYSVSWDNTRKSCTNKPSYSYYTSDGNWSATGCSWSCNSWYWKDWTICVPICTFWSSTFGNCLFW